MIFFFTNKEFEKENLDEISKNRKYRNIDITLAPTIDEIDGVNNIRQKVSSVPKINEVEKEPEEENIFITNTNENNPIIHIKKDIIDVPSENIDLVEQENEQSVVEQPDIGLVFYEKQPYIVFDQHVEDVLSDKLFGNSSQYEGDEFGVALNEQKTLSDYLPKLSDYVEEKIVNEQPHSFNHDFNEEQYDENDVFANGEYKFHFENLKLWGDDDVRQEKILNRLSKNKDDKTQNTKNEIEEIILKDVDYQNQDIVFDKDIKTERVDATNKKKIVFDNPIVIGKKIINDEIYPKDIEMKKQINDYGKLEFKKFDHNDFLNWKKGYDNLHYVDKKNNMVEKEIIKDSSNQFLKHKEGYNKSFNQQLIEMLIEKSKKG